MGAISFQVLFLLYDKNAKTMLCSSGCPAGLPEAGIKLHLRAFKHNKAETYSTASKFPSIGSIIFPSGALRSKPALVAGFDFYPNRKFELLLIYIPSTAYFMIQIFGI
jgi:hypothetical protein